MTNIVVYDIEIEKPVPPKDEPMEPGIEYCDGWGDHAGMGIAIVSAYSLATGIPYLFCKDNIEELFRLLDEADVIAGFNNRRFDDKIMAAVGYEIPEEKSYDLFVEIKEAAGAKQYAKGYNLDNCCMINLGIQKAGDAAQVPVLWQRGQYGRCFNYAMRDITMEYLLLKMAMEQPLIDPGNPGGPRIFVKSPA